MRFFTPLVTDLLQLCVEHKEVTGIVLLLIILFVLFRRFLRSEMVQSKVRAWHHVTGVVKQRYRMMVGWVATKSRIAAAVMPHFLFVGAMLYFQHQMAGFRCFD